MKPKLSELADKVYRSLPYYLKIALSYSQWGINEDDGVCRLAIDCNSFEDFETIREDVESIIDKLENETKMRVEGGIFYCKKKPGTCTPDCQKTVCGIYYFGKTDNLARENSQLCDIEIS